jgi:hypothetical protein
MVHVSAESAAVTRRRLLAVIAQAEFDVLEGTFAFQEFPRAHFPGHLAEQALAMVADLDVWSALAPAGGAARERFAVLCFHFPDELDNSGFVGWLASHLKRRLGTGVAVVCGSNSGRGGIFDYWCVPIALRDAAQLEVLALRKRGEAILATR